MKTFTLLLTFLLASSGLLAQQSHWELAFRISPEEALSLHQGEAEPGERFFHTLVDTFYLEDTARSLPPGHYLRVSALEQVLRVELESTHSFYIRLIPNERDLAVQALDTLGRLAPDGRVWLGRRELPYSPADSAFILRKWRREGLLRVEVGGEVAFLQLNDEKVQTLMGQRLRRFSSTPVGGVLTFPVRLGKRLFWSFKVGFRNGSWRLFPRSRRPFKGYMALSKPMYRPGDTLHMKAYVTNHRGRPLRRQFALKVYQDGQEVHRTHLDPLLPGTFNHSMALPDSFPLNRNYQLALEEAKGKRRYRRRLQQRFELRDYQLKEVNFFIHPEKAVFYPGDTIRLLASATGASGLPMPGGQLRLVLETIGAKGFREDEAVVPDTLWQQEQPLLPLQETPVIVPGSIFPEATVNTRMTAYFVAPGGEIRQFTSGFRYQLRDEQLVLRLDGQWLVGEYFRDGQPDTSRARLSTTLLSTDPLRDTMLHLPFRMPLNPLASIYELSGRGQQASIFINYGPQNTISELSVSGTNQEERVAFRISNPRRLPLSWFLYCQGKEAAHGWSRDSLIQWEQPNPSGASYQLKWVFTWGGKTVEEELQLPYFKKLLQLSIEQPQRVAPMQEVPIRIKALRQDGRPAPGVNLSAGAIRAQFQRQPYLAPQVEYRRPKEPLVYNRFREEPLDSRVFSMPIEAEWYRRLGLDSQLFYRLRHPPDGVLLEYDTLDTDTFYRELAQFAPYIVKEGIEQPILLAYCNRELVYYADAHPERPYSFSGQPGSNTLILRTAEYEYTVEGVPLYAGQKLEIAIDENRFGASAWAERISRRPVRPYLTYQELQLLKETILELKGLPANAEVYVWRDSTAIFPVKNFNAWQTGNLKLGPFPGKGALHFVRRGGFEVEVPFEPGFIYEINAGRDRLYQSNTFKAGQEVRPKVQQPFHLPGERLLRPADIRRDALPSPRLELEPFSQAKPARTGRYQYEYQATERLLYVLLTQEGRRGRTLRLYSQTPLVMAPGDYTLYFFRSDGSYQERRAKVRPDTLLFQRIDPDAFVADSAQVLLRRFFFEGVDSVDLEKIYGLRSSNRLTGGRKRLITGRVMDQQSREPLIFASVAVFRDGVLITGTETDFDGNYSLVVPYGPLDIQVSYIGYQTTRVRVFPNQAGRQNIWMNAGGAVLSEVMVMGSPVRVERDATTSVSVAGLGRPARTASESLEAEAGQLPEADSLINWGAYSGLRAHFRDYAYWEPTLVTDKNGEAFFTATFPGNLTNWETYAIGMGRKGRAGAAAGIVQSYKPLAAQLYLPRFLLSGDRAAVVGQAVNYTPDSLFTFSYFQMGEERIGQVRTQMGKALEASMDLLAPEGKDSVELTYALEMDGFIDGEKRSIPVFPVGTPETVGEYATIEGDTSLEWRFNPDLGPVTLYAQADVLQFLLPDIDYLKAYPYGCNEQTASRLLALLMERDIRQALGEPWEGTAAVLEAVGKLQRSQNGDGSWGWWPEGKGNTWMTIYVLSALQQAEAAGFSSRAYELGLRFLTNTLPALADEGRLSALRLLASEGQNLDYERLLAPYDSLLLPVAERLLTIAIRQEAGLDYRLDSLYALRKSTALGNHYWGNQQAHWRDNSIAPTLLAYRLLREAGRDDELSSIRRYLLDQRRPGRRGWRNTFETAQILATLLPDIMARQQGGSLDNRLWINGEEQALGKPALSAHFAAGAPLRIRKEGPAPVYLTAYQSFFNREPEARGGLFDVSTRLWQGGREVDSLKQGLPARLVTTLEVKAAGDYVMIEVPIPAGCSYYREPNSRRYPEVHREYFREKVAIFCERLEPGEYEFTIELEPRFSGKYTLNPAKAELMYFPTFYGRNGIKRIGINP